MKKLSIVLLMISAAFTTFADNIEINGLYYRIDPTTLEAEVVRNYDESYRPNQYKGDIVVPDSVIVDGVTYPVTKIGSFAFSGSPEITSITLGENIKELGQSAFSNCANLTSFTIPKNVVRFGSGLFKGCNKIKSILFQPENLSKIDNGYIGSVSDLLIPECVEEMIFDDGVKVIPGGLLTYHQGIKTIKMGDNVQKISDNAFYDCSNLSSITLSKGLKTIGQSAFNSCKGITSLILPDALERIDYYAFSGCSNLKSISFGKGLKELGWCSFRFNYSLEALDLPDGLTKIEQESFLDCSSISSIRIPASVTDVGINAFSGCYVLREKVENLSGVNLNTWSGITYPEKVTADGLIINGDKILRCRANSTIVSIPNNIKTIGGKAFYGCFKLTSITIPSNITDIYSDAFTRCSSLTSVKINDLSAWCKINFSNDTSNPLRYAHNLILNGKEITDLVIPNGISAIRKNSFYGGNFTSVKFPDGLETIGEDAFHGCKSIQSLDLPDGLKIIENSSFAECSSLAFISFPSTLWKVEQYAFAVTPWLTSQPDGIVYAGKTAYSYHGVMPDNTQLSFKEGTEYIAAEMFTKRTGLVSLVIPKSIKEIGSSAFVGNQNLKTIYFNAENCEKCGGNYTVFPPNVEKVYFGSSVRKIPTNAFYGMTGLTSVAICDSIVTIGYASFWGCKNLQSVILSENVESIESSVFSGCTNLNSVTSLRTTPPAITSYTFSTYGILRVLPGCKSAYENAEFWKNFTIVEDEELVTYIPGIKIDSIGNGKKYTLDGQIINGEPTNGTIYIMNGRKHLQKL